MYHLPVNDHTCILQSALQSVIHLAAVCVHHLYILSFSLSVLVYSSAFCSAKTRPHESISAAAS